MRLYLAVGFGGIIGTVLRYVISVLFWTDQTTVFPWATYIVNISGAFLLTFIVFQPYFVKKLSPLLFVGFTTGVLGSYTTFSMLIHEIITLWVDSISLALVYSCATIFGGVLASYAGYLVANITNKSGGKTDVY